MARARSEGSQLATNGLSVNTAPTAAVALVATVRNLRRLWSTSSGLAVAATSVIDHYSPAGARPSKSALAAVSGETHDCPGKCRIIHIPSGAPRLRNRHEPEKTRIRLRLPGGCD